MYKPLTPEQREKFLEAQKLFGKDEFDIRIGCCVDWVVALALGCGRLSDDLKAILSRDDGVYVFLSDDQKEEALDPSIKLPHPSPASWGEFFGKEPLECGDWEMPDTQAGSKIEGD